MLFNFKIVDLLSYLLCLIPLVLLTGPFLPDLFVSIISIFFLVIVIKNKEWKYFNNSFFFIFFAFYIFLIIGSIFSRFPIDSLSSSLFYIRFILFSLAVWYLLEKKQNLLKMFLLSFLFTFVFAIIDGYIQYFTELNIFGNDVYSKVRLALTFNFDTLFLGGYLSRLFPLLLALLLFCYPNNKKILAFTCILLIAVDVLVYISGERTAIGLMLIATICFIMMISNFKIIRICTFIISILILVIITLSDSSIRERNINYTIKQMNLDSSMDTIIYSSEHDKIFTTGLTIFYENPIFGVGSKLYRNYCKEGFYEIDINHCSTHPHSIYIQLLAETGILGFTFALSIFIYFIYIAMLNIKRRIFKEKEVLNNFQSCLVICFFLTLFPFLPSQSIFNNFINVIFYMPIGFYLFSKKNNLNSIID